MAHVTHEAEPVVKSVTITLNDKEARDLQEILGAVGRVDTAYDILIPLSEILGESEYYRAVLVNVDTGETLDTGDYMLTLEDS